MVNSRPDHPLRRWRKEHKLSVADAAHGVGAPRQLWFDWEKGRRRPGPKYMPRVREFTGGVVTADHFYPDDDSVELQDAA